MFHFKQFTIRQDHTAMKVCTDACILGAYANVGINTPVRILDIGTGTGLLALMAAQRNPLATIDAVEIDEAAARQATDNVAASGPFANRVRVVPGRIQLFEPAQPMADGTAGAPTNNRLCPLRYDRILTNPPFYTNHLRSPRAAVNRALHTDELPFSELTAAVARLLQPGGQWWVLLPPYQTAKLTELAQLAGIRPFRRLQVRHTDQKAPFRLVTGFAHGASTIEEETLTIYAPDGKTYTPAFRALLHDFYVIF